MSYQVNGHTVDTLQEVADILEVPKVSLKDIKDGGKYAGMVSIDGDDTPEVSADASDDTVQELDTNGDGLVSEEEARLAFLPDGEDFTDLKDLKDVITDIDTPTLEYLAKSLGADFTPSDNAQIHRMRIAQSLHRYFFPELFQPKEPKKKKAKYGDFDDVALAKLATTHKVKWEKSEHAPINRMRLIMALKKAGHLPE